MLVYVAAGRIATPDTAPIVMTPGQLMSSGDPVGAEARLPTAEPVAVWPVATVDRGGGASKLGGTSVAALYSSRAEVWEMR